MCRTIIRVSGVWALLLCGVSASARPPYLEAWKARYPESSLPARMEAATESECHVCHHPPARSELGNCYRQDLISLLGEGLTIEDAINQLDGKDSDGDGVPNGREATTRRSDDPDQIGYNMGLVGSNGTDPCADDPGEVVTGMPETPPVPVPAMSDLSTLGMVAVLLVAGIVVPVRRRASLHAGCDGGAARR